ncbi:calcineurin A [Pelomyxa schiedti]|nr:calcineurin A [Pelomyxa schiedti]
MQEQEAATTDGSRSTSNTTSSTAENATNAATSSTTTASSGGDVLSEAPVVEVEPPEEESGEKPPLTFGGKPKIPFGRPNASTTERIVKSVPYPAADPIPTEVLFVDDGIDVDALRKHLALEGKLKAQDVLTIVKRVKNIFLNEPTLLHIDAPLTVCGDVHGQFWDLMKLLDIGGNVLKTTYLFLGDYVDRGNFSCEVVFLLYALKITYPKTFWMIRGNHECRHLTEFFTFKQECLHKYSQQIYDAIMESFDALPLGALVAGHFLCIHGGISPEIRTLDDIKRIDRFHEPPQTGPMCDLLWADPAENFTSDEVYSFNEVRGCSYVFTFRAACAFLERNRLLSIIRAHEAQDEGFKMYLHRENAPFPTVITVFSAPNYLDTFNNKGAVLRYERNCLNIRQFNQVPHPYWLPNFMNVFTWSLPFVAEKIAEMLLSFLRLCDDADGVGDDDQDERELDALFGKSEPTRTRKISHEPVSATDSVEVARAKRKYALQQKILSVSRFMSIFNTLRTERDTVLQIKQMTGGASVPKGLLLEGPNALIQALGSFKAAQLADRMNERRPPMPTGSNTTSLTSPRVDDPGGIQTPSQSPNLLSTDDTL